MNKITIYTKVCLPCVYKGRWTDIQRSVWRAGYDMKIVRTTYAPELHKEATTLWGADNYIAFAIMPNGEAVAVGRIKRMFEDIHDKMIKTGKSKPVRKEKKNVQRLRKTKRPIRVDTVEDSPVEVKVETKTRQKISGKGGKINVL